MDCRPSLKNSSLFVHILVALFGIGSWLDINGVWVELPILVDHLPEGWSLGSYLIIIIQVANIGPLLYSVGHLLAPKIVTERPVVYLILTVGAAACMLLAFLWNKTTVVAGVEHSTPLLILNFFLGTVDCTSSIVFLTFMSFFKTTYMTSYFIGEGLSGLVPSLVAIGQGVGEMTCNNVSTTNSTLFNNSWINKTSYGIQPTYHPPRFEPMVFFIILFVLMVISLCAFTMLNFLPICKREQVSNVYQVTSSDSTNYVNPTLTRQTGVFSSSISKTYPIADSSKRNGVNYDQVLEKGSGKDLKASTLPTLTRWEFAFFLVLTAWLNALGNGVLPSLQSYACLPYGNETYHLAVTLAQIANPVSCFLAFFISVKSKWTISVLTFCASCVAGYVLTVAALSPRAILLGLTSGTALAVLSQVLVMALITYTKVSIATVCRGEGRRALFWFGVVTQVGSLIGAIITFLLVNIFQMFKSAPPCPAEVFTNI